MGVQTDSHHALPHLTLSLKSDLHSGFLESAVMKLRDEAEQDGLPNGLPWKDANTVLLTDYISHGPPGH